MEKTVDGWADEEVVWCGRVEGERFEKWWEESLMRISRCGRDLLKPSWRKDSPLVRLQILDMVQSPC